MNDNRDESVDARGPSGALRPTAEEFALWGVGQVGYARPATFQGTLAYGIFDGLGRQLAIAASGEAAYGALIRLGLEPVAVH